MPTSPRGSARFPFSAVVILVAIVATTVLLFVRFGGPAEPAPDVAFMPVTTDLASLTLRQGTPVVAVVTADWCGPCQQLKRDSLSDERVRALLEARAQPVMLDGTDTEAAMPSLQHLGVRAFPTTVIVRDGRPVARLEGYVSAEKYLAWLEANL
jgi:thioredoxin 1